MGDANAAIYDANPKVKAVLLTGSVARTRQRPLGLLGRLEGLFRLEPGSTVSELYTRVDEVLSLVETHLPGVSTAGARNRLAMTLRQ